MNTPSDLDAMDEPLEIFRTTTRLITEQRAVLDKTAAVRARAVAALYARGYTYKDLAGLLDLSAPRVGQLVGSTEDAAVVVLRAWADIERQLAKVIGSQAINAKSVYRSAIAVLAGSGRFDAEALEEIKRLYRTRNKLVHARRDVEPQEAELIANNALYLNALLQVYLTERARVPRDPDSSGENGHLELADVPEDPERRYVPVDLGDASFARSCELPVVPDGKIAELPFPLRFWADFERLIVALAVDVDDLFGVRRYGTSGQEQDGIDIVGFTRLGHHAHAYQCKNVRDFTESDLLGAIAKFVEGRRPFSPKRLVVAVASTANRTQLVKALEDAALRNPDLVLELWDAPRINDLLRERPRIVEQFFGQDVAHRFCLSTSFPAVADPQSPAAEGGVTLEVIMRGPLRSLGFASRFDEAVGVEQGNPAAAATVFADIAQHLSAAGFGGHANALRRRAIQAYGTAGRHSAAIQLHLRVVADGVLAGRWSELGGQLWVLRQLIDGLRASGDAPEAGVEAAISVLGAVEALFSDPVLVQDTVAAAVGAASRSLDALLGQLPEGASNRGVVLLAAGAAAVSAAEFAVATEAFAAVVAAEGVLSRLAGALTAGGSQTGAHLGVRLRLAAAEARDPFARDDGGWAQLQGKATSWELDDRDAALVLARYARARARDAASAEADAAWRRAAEFAARARLFSDIAGWMSAQVRLRYRYGPIDWTELGNLRQMINLLDQQPSDRITPISSAREEALDDLRKGEAGLRSAALAAQRLRVLAAAAGLWEDEQGAHSLLGDIFERSGEPLLAAYHRVRAAQETSKTPVVPSANGAFLDITAQLDRPAPAERSAAYSLLAVQADLIPDNLVDVIADRACDDIAGALAGRLAETPFAGPGILRSAAAAAAAVAGRLSTETASKLVHALDQRLEQDKGTVAWTDESHLRMLVLIAASDDDHNAAAAFSGIARLLAIESPALRLAGRDLGPAVSRRPGDVRQILVVLAEQGSDHAAEMLAGWSLTGSPGRGGARSAAEQSAWQAALPFAERAAGRLAAPPEGTSGSASLIVGFPGEAGLVTILDPPEIDRALTGLLRVAADRLHLSATRQQALSAASILAAGDTGDRLGATRLSEIFDLACEYARGEHDGSAMDDLTTSAHPLSSWRISMGESTLAADGLCLGARASRTPAERAVLLGVAAQIVQGKPEETVLNGVAHALAALPSLAGAPTSLAIPALVSSPSESIRAIGALHWAIAFGPADAEDDPDGIGAALAGDPSPVVRRSLAGQLAIIANRSGLSAAGSVAAGALGGDLRWEVRRAANDALNTISGHGAP
jgi:uncharacterized protein YutE (UPF0331/DUF86 family)